MYHLYYAGMAQDGKTEQIGLAVSEDGTGFKRINKDGLIIPIDKSIDWKSVRVCNPYVIMIDGEYKMFYQGIGSFKGRQLCTSISIATSNNGVEWQCLDHPLLHWGDMSAYDSRQNSVKRIDLIEPCVLEDNGTLKMWFIYRNKACEGNWLCYAESDGSGNWAIRQTAVLTGRQFGPFLLHYPQVVKDKDGYQMYFTLINTHNKAHGIFSMSSIEGYTWTNLKQILPETYNGFSVKPRALFDLGHSKWKIHKAVQMANLYALKLLTGGKKYWGFSHPHIISTQNETWMYYHNTNLPPGINGRQGYYYTIGRCKLTDQRIMEKKLVFDVSAGNNWDSRFVADPFVMEI